MARGATTGHTSRSGGRPAKFNLVVVTGAGADTNIAIAGIKKIDQLESVIEVPAATTTLVDRTATTSITTDGNIQCTASTSGNQLIVIYWSGSLR